MKISRFFFAGSLISFFAFFLSLSVFIDPKLFFIYTTGSHVIGTQIFSIYLVLIILSCFYLLVNNSFSKDFWLVFGFGVYGSLLNLIRGLDLGTAAMHFGAYACLPLFCFISKRGAISKKALTKAFFIYSLLHLLFILYSMFIDSSLLATSTQYGEVYDLYTRSVGMFSAPGVLGFYAIMAVSYSLAVFKISGGILNTINLILGIILGLLSGNRSFILALVFILIAFFFSSSSIFRKKPERNVAGYYIIGAFIVLAVILTFRFSEQIEYVLTRFDLDMLNTDFETRYSGEFGALPGLLSLLSNPIFGNAFFDNYTETMRVMYDGRSYSVNNGFVSIFAYYGIPAALLFYYVYVKRIFIYYQNAKLSKRQGHDSLNSALFYMILGGTLVCMGDAFLQVPIMLMLITGFSYKSNLLLCENSG